MRRTTSAITRAMTNPHAMAANTNISRFFRDKTGPSGKPVSVFG
jgi:hypothetical protein